jgi:anti-sigma factor RsiW
MNRSELLWKHIEGQCSPEEQQEVERLLAEDAAVKLEWAQVQRLHHALQQQEPEQPSMRFAKNVMERLPALYRKLSIQPLLSPRAKRVFAGLLGLFFAAYFYFAYLYLQANPASVGDSPLDKLADTFLSLPMTVMSLLAALSCAFLLLAWLDKRLKKRQLS